MNSHAAEDPAAKRDLLLEVVINGRPVGLTGEFVERAGQLYATGTDLDAMGFRVSTGAAADPATELPLRGLPGVSYRVEDSTQTIYVTAPNRALKPTNLQVGAERDADSPLETGLGGVANYDVIATRAGGKTVAEGVLVSRVYTPWGVAASNFVAVYGADRSVRPLVRLDTTYAYSERETLRQYRGGDLITGGLSWSRPVRLGGVQITTDFAIRPDLVTFPVPSINGQVAVPSSVDVLVNGVQLLSRAVPPGPFEVRQLPIVTGSGDVSVVVRDASGQQTTQTLPVYSTTLLLRPGLSSFSAELGAVRLNYGVQSDDYRTPAAALSYRYGLTDWLTLEGHGEASAGGHTYGGPAAAAGGMLGGGAAFTVGSLGVFSVDAAGSRFGKRSGGLVAAAFERSASIISLAGSIQLATRDFSDIASLFGDPVPRLQARASVGLSLGAFGSLGVAYVAVRRPAFALGLQNSGFTGTNATTTGPLDFASLIPASRISLVSASYSRTILAGRANLYVTAYRDLDHGSTFGMLAGLTIPLGRRSSVGVSGGDSQSGPYGSVQVNQSASEVGDFGWQAQGTTGREARQLGVAQYKSPWALVEGGVDRTVGQTALRGSVQGAVAYAANSFFATNTIYDSFAIVDTDKTPGIQVLQENRPVGRSNAAGLLLVPDLRSFENNRLGIDPTDVPMDTDVGQISRFVRPQDRTGVVVHFAVHRSRGAILRLVDTAGQPIAVGSRARLLGSKGVEVPVGYDGESFVTGLAGHETVIVTRPGGTLCKAVFDYVPVTDALPTIGPIPCLDVTP